MSSESVDLPPSGPGDITSAASRQAFDAVPPGIVIIDVSGSIVLVNSAAEGMFQYERNQLEGQPIQALVPAENQSDPDRVAAFFEPSGTRLTGTGTEYTVLRRDGTEFHAEIGLRPLPTTEGIWIVACVVDLTERKRLTITDRDQNERAAAYCEAASEGMIAVDASGIIEMVNKATERMFGYDRSELVGQPLEVVVPDGHRRPHVEKREGYFAKPGHRPMGTGSGSDFLGRRKDGTQFPVEVGLNFARIGDRTVAVAFITDISEKRRLQEQSAALGTLVDLQQQLAASSRRDAASADSDPLTGLDRRAMFEPTVARAGSDLEGLYAVVYSIQRMQPMKARFGVKTADRIVVFASQYIANTLDRDSDRLFRWENSAFVSLIRRDSDALLVQREVSDACGKRLECFLENAGGGSIVMIALLVKVLPLEQVTLPEAVAEIERFVLPGTLR